MESVNEKKPMGNFKSAAASRRSSKKLKGFMKNKEGDVDFSVVSDIDVDEVEDLQPVVVAGDVSEKSDNIDVNMNDYNENSDNALLINETSKDTSSSVPVSVDVPASVPVVNKYKKYRETFTSNKTSS